jgi:hypothetical protein
MFIENRSSCGEASSRHPPLCGNHPAKVSESIVITHSQQIDAYRDFPVAAVPYHGQVAYLFHFAMFSFQSAKRACQLIGKRTNLHL